MKKSTSSKQKTLKLSRQAQGTLAKTIAMVEEQDYCIDILQQMDSVIGLITKAKKQLLAGHLNNCLAVQPRAAREKTVQELLKIYQLSSV
jgi:DNA-binding FrmR family transcriptional regulator